MTYAPTAVTATTWRFHPRAPAKRGDNLVMQVAAGVFLGGLALWLVQLGATALYAKLMLATVTFGG